MTTYRRFCCNDLLRLGSLRTNSDTQTPPVDYYMHHLAASPGNCHVADMPGGRIAGYILGLVVVDGEVLHGQVSMSSILHKDLIIFLMDKLLNLMDCCRKIYRAYTMKVFLGPNHFQVRKIFQELGYEVHKVDGERIEMRKQLSGPISNSPLEDELDRIENSRLTSTIGFSSTFFKTPECEPDVQDEFERIDRIESSGLSSSTDSSTSRSLIRRRSNHSYRKH